jgi:hypothetical protein
MSNFDYEFEGDRHLTKKIINISKSLDGVIKLETFVEHQNKYTMMELEELLKNGKDLLNKK